MVKKFQKSWSIIADHILIAHVLNLQYKIEYLRTILIDIGKYTKSEVKQYIDDIC